MKLRSISHYLKFSYSSILISSKYGSCNASLAPIRFLGLNSSIYFNKLRPYSSAAGYISLRSIG